MRSIFIRELRREQRLIVLVRGIVAVILLFASRWRTTIGRTRVSDVFEVSGMCQLEERGTQNGQVYESDRIN